MPQEGIKPLTTENAVIAGVGKKVLPNDDVELVATAKTKFYEAGQKFTAHSALAEKLIAKGAAEKAKEGKK